MKSLHALSKGADPMVGYVVRTIQAIVSHAWRTVENDGNFWLDINRVWIPLPRSVVQHLAAVYAFLV